TVHFPDVARRFPFRGRGFYFLEGKVTEDFGVAAVEVGAMEKVPFVDKRMEIQDSVSSHQSSVGSLQSSVFSRQSSVTSLQSSVGSCLLGQAHLKGITITHWYIFVRLHLLK